MKLGFIMNNIRYRGDFSQHRVKLEELDFIYEQYLMFNLPRFIPHWRLTRLFMVIYWFLSSLLYLKMMQIIHLRRGE
jgi:hypothetical protein